MVAIGALVVLVVEPASWSPRTMLQVLVSPPAVQVRTPLADAFVGESDSLVACAELVAKPHVISVRSPTNVNTSRRLILDTMPPM